MKSIQQLSNAAGIGLRLPHIAEVVATRPQTGFLEIHPENFLANPHAAELLVELSRYYAISFHTVGISIGSATGIDRSHLQRIRTLMDRVNPILVSGHLAWSTFGNDYMNDLLPLPFNWEVVQLVASHVREVQDFLGRPYLVENPSSYVGFKTSTMGEAEFLSELVRQTQCRLLCDVSNAYLSAHNMGYDARTYIENLPADSIAELHLGGYTAEEDESNRGRQLLIDSHAAAIAEPAWDLYAHAIHRFGAVPTLIEWDNNIPALPELLGEAKRADAIARKVKETYCAATR
jgi:uncharacterized protein (UPF0276 family)